MGGIQLAKKPEKKKSEFEEVVSNIKRNMESQVNIISECII